MTRTAVIFTNYGPYHVARARGLAKVADIEPCFLELASKESKYPWQIDRSRVDIDLRTLVRGSYEQTPFRELWQKLARTFEDLKPGAVVVPSYSPPIMLAAARWAKRHGAVSIMMNETTEVDHPRVWWKERIKSFLVKQYYDGAFVGGRASREYISKLGMPSTWIWEGYDVVDNVYFSAGAERVLERQREYRELAGLPRDYFLYVGRFSSEKNLIRLLEAYRRYRQQPNPWSLVLVGDGPQREEIFRTVQRLGLEDVVCPGFKQIEDLPLYYALGSTFILPSTSEPWGLVVNEAMASGLPVLVSNRCGSAHNLVSQGNNGYTFDPYDVGDMADCMLKLSDSSDALRRAMSETSREIIALYTPDAWGENLADCIKRTLERVNRSTAPSKRGD